MTISAQQHEIGVSFGTWNLGVVQMVRVITTCDALPHPVIFPRSRDKPPVLAFVMWKCFFPERFFGARRRRARYFGSMYMVR